MDLMAVNMPGAVVTMKEERQGSTDQHHLYFLKKAVTSWWNDRGCTGTMECLLKRVS